MGGIPCKNTLLFDEFGGEPRGGGFDADPGAQRAGIFISGGVGKGDCGGGRAAGEGNREPGDSA